MNASDNNIPTVSTRNKENHSQEVLGLQSQTSLLVATFQSLLFCVVLIGVFTVGPYAIGKYLSRSETVPVAKEVKKEEPKQEVKKDPKKDDKKPTKPEVVSKDSATVSKDAAKKLGIDETKTGTPSTNPFENKPGADPLKDLLDK